MLIRLGSQESNIAPYNAIYKDAERLLENNIEGVLGVDADIIYDIFSGEGTIYSIGASEETAVFLKSPIKIESAVFEAKEGSYLPRISFHFGSDIVYDTEEETDSYTLNLTDTLFGQMIDAIYFYGSEGMLNKVNIQARSTYEGEIEIIHSVTGTKYNESISPKSIKDINGKELTLSKNITGSQSQGAIFWIEEGLGEAILGCGFCNVSPTPNESNIEITYSVIDAEKPECEIGEACIADTGNVILALAKDSTIYLSCGAVGFGYFPVGLKRKIGTDGNITALCSMSDFSLGVFKSDGVYYFEPKIENSRTELALSGYSSQGGSLSHFATKTVNLDTLSVVNECIFGSVGGTKRVRRGDNIALDLKNRKLDNAVAIEHNGCYYLFVDGYVYVADSRYKIYENNRLDSSFQYEWWCLDNIPASYVAKIKGLIYIGREDGRIVSFYDGYSDIYYEKIDTDSYLLGENESGNTIVYLNDEFIQDKILVTYAYSYFGAIASQTVVDNKIKLFLEASDFWSYENFLKIYPNMIIYMQNEGGALTEATVEAVDAGECSVILNLNENSDTYTDIFLSNERKEYTLVAENDYFLMLDEYGAPVKLINTENVLLEFEKSAPVAAEYVSSAILNDIGSKNLYGIAIELLWDSRGQCELCYETDSTIMKRSYGINTLFDFDELNFNYVTFNSGLQKSYTLRCFERGFDYIIVKLKHSDNKPFSLKGYKIIYTKNKGE